MEPLSSTERDIFVKKLKSILSLNPLACRLINGRFGKLCLDYLENLEHRNDEDEKVLNCSAITYIDSDWNIFQINYRQFVIFCCDIWIELYLKFQEEDQDEQEVTTIIPDVLVNLDDNSKQNLRIPSTVVIIFGDCSHWAPMLIVVIGLLFQFPFYFVDSLGKLEQIVKLRQLSGFCFHFITHRSRVSELESIIISQDSNLQFKDSVRNLKFDSDYRMCTLESPPLKTSKIEEIDTLIQNVLQLPNIVYITNSSGTLSSSSISQKSSFKLIFVLLDSVRCYLEQSSSKHWFQLNSLDTILVTTPLTFDPSMFDIFLALISGSHLILSSGFIRNSPKNLLRIFSQFEVTYCTMTPSVWNRFSLESIQNRIFGNNSRLRYVNFGGEQGIRIDNLRSYFEHCSSSRLPRINNLYGLSEMSVWSSCFAIDQENLETLEQISKKYLQQNQDGKFYFTSFMPINELKIQDEDVCCYLLEDRGNIDDNLAVFGEIIIEDPKRRCLILDCGEDTLWKYLAKLRTGDIGCRIQFKDPNQDRSYLYFVGRAQGRDDFVKLNGVKCYLPRIEQIVLERFGTTLAGNQSFIEESKKESLLGERFGTTAGNRSSIENPESLPLVEQFGTTVGNRSSIENPESLPLVEPFGTLRNRSSIEDLESLPLVEPFGTSRNRSLIENPESLPLVEQFGTLRNRSSIENPESLPLVEPFGTLRNRSSIEDLESLPLVEPFGTSRNRSLIENPESLPLVEQFGTTVGNRSSIKNTKSLPLAEQFGTTFGNQSSIEDPESPPLVEPFGTSRNRSSIEDPESLPLVEQFGTSRNRSSIDTIPESFPLVELFGTLRNRSSIEDPKSLPLVERCFAVAGNWINWNNSIVILVLGLNRQIERESELEQLRTQICHYLLNELRLPFAFRFHFTWNFQNQTFLSEHGKFDLEKLIDSLRQSRILQESIQLEQMTQSEIESIVVSIVENILDLNNINITKTSKLQTFGLKSMSALQISMEIDSKFQFLNQSPEYNEQFGKLYELILNEDIETISKHLAEMIQPKDSTDPIGTSNKVSKIESSLFSETNGSVSSNTKFPTIISKYQYQLSETKPDGSGSFDLRKRTFSSIRLKSIWNVFMEECVDSTPLLIGTEAKTILIGASHSGLITAINLDPFQTIWSIHLGHRIESSPVASKDGRLLFIGDQSSGQFHALCTDTGNTVWEFRTGNQILGCAAVLDVTDMVVVAPQATTETGIEFSLVYCGSFDQHLYCWHQDTGKLRWKLNVCNSAMSTSGPVLYRSGSSWNLLIATLNGTITNVSALDGTILWQQSKMTRFPIFATPLVLSTFPEEDDDSTRVAICGLVNNLIVALKLTDGSILWTTSINGNIMASPIVVSNHSGSGSLAIFGTHSKLVLCLDTGMGKIVWQHESTAPILANPVSLENGTDTVAIIETNGNISFYNWNDGSRIPVISSGEEEEEKPEKLHLKLASEIISTPIFYQNRLFVGSRDNQLHCFSVEFVE